MKRAFDVALCLLALPCALLACLLCMIAICLESVGSPVFYQMRVGRYGRPFAMLKLRSMRGAVDDLPTHLTDAARLTRVGRFLRVSKLDELPQVLNVLAGSMSLVGPRPCLLTQNEVIAARVQRGLLDLRPGITGPGQLLRLDMAKPTQLAEAEAYYFSSSTLRSDTCLLIRSVVGDGSGDMIGT